MQVTYSSRLASCFMQAIAKNEPLSIGTEQWTDDALLVLAGVLQDELTRRQALAYSEVTDKDGSRHKTAGLTKQIAARLADVHAVIDWCAQGAANVRNGTYGRAFEERHDVDVAYVANRIVLQPRHGFKTPDVKSQTDAAALPA